MTRQRPGSSRRPPRAAATLSLTRGRAMPNPEARDCKRHCWLKSIVLVRAARRPSPNTFERLGQGAAATLVPLTGRTGRTEHAPTNQRR